MTLEERLKILVVEDGDVFRRNISSGLRVLGFQKVTCVSNGKDAIDYMRVNPVNLVISDWYMEPINGLQLVRWMRAEVHFKNVPFLMLSGETAKEKVIEAVKAGIDSYIVKPFTVNLLGLKINEALKRRNIV